MTLATNERKPRRGDVCAVKRCEYTGSSTHDTDFGWQVWQVVKTDRNGNITHVCTCRDWGSREPKAGGGNTLQSERISEVMSIAPPYYDAARAVGLLNERHPGAGELKRSIEYRKKHWK